MPRPAAVLAVAVLLALAGCTGPGAYPVDVADQTTRTTAPPSATTADDQASVSTAAALRLDHELAPHARTTVHAHDGYLHVVVHTENRTVRLPENDSSLVDPEDGRQAVMWTVVQTVIELRTDQIHAPVVVEIRFLNETMATWRIQPAWVHAYEAGRLENLALWERIRETRESLLCRATERPCSYTEPAIISEYVFCSAGVRSDVSRADRAGRR